MLNNAITISDDAATLFVLLLSIGAVMLPIVCIWILNTLFSETLFKSKIPSTIKNYLAMGLGLIIIFLM